MDICVFGASSSIINKEYVKATELLCEEMAKRGHNLVFGAGMNGLMGAAARGTKSGDGKITGVIPEFFREENIEAIYDACDELIFTNTMRDRKEKMEDLSDAFIVVPGGIGTFEEMFEVLTLKQLGRHTKPIVLFNYDGFFKGLSDFMRGCTDRGFIYANVHQLYICSDNHDVIFNYIENTASLNYSVHDLKNG